MLLLLAGLSEAWALEEGLAGINIGSSPKQLMEVFGPPTGTLISGEGGAPTLVQWAFGGAAAGGGLLPPWAYAVRPATLGSNQQLWAYDLGKKAKGLAAGFVITGQGPDAVVTDIIAASFKPAPAAQAFAQTRKGVHLGSSFQEVLLAYGYPPAMEIFVEQGVAGGTTAGVGMPGMPYMPYMPMPGGQARPTAGGMALPPMFGSTPPSYQPQAARPPGYAGPASTSPYYPGTGTGLYSLYAPGGAGAPSLYAPGGAGAGLPPALSAYGGAAGAPGAGMVAMVNREPISFSKSLSLYYSGLALTLHDLKVVRIHVSE